MCATFSLIGGNLTKTKFYLPSHLVWATNVLAEDRQDLSFIILVFQKNYSTYGGYQIDV